MIYNLKVQYLFLSTGLSFYLHEFLLNRATIKNKEKYIGISFISSSFHSKHVQEGDTET